MEGGDGSSQASCDVNDLIEFWTNEDTTKYRFEKNRDHDYDCYSTADARQIPTIAIRLEKMSSMSIAMALWHRAAALIPELKPDELGCDNSFIRRVRKWVSQLKLPKLLAKNVVDHVIDIVEQVCDWIKYHFREMYQNERNDLSTSYQYYIRYRYDWGRDKRNKSTLRRCARLISWHSNGAINYCQTARNLLKSEELGSEEKYRLACIYCLKTEIVNRRKTLVKIGILRAEPNYPRHEYSLIEYWNCHCASKLSWLPIQGFQSVDEFTIRKKNVNNWTAIEYFFDRLDAEKQIASAVYFIDPGNVEIQDLMLAKMNETQRLNLYANKAEQIIVNYLRRGGADINEPSAFSIWYKICDWITEDQFVSLLRGLCEAPVENYFLMEIWTSANQKLKSHILNLDDYDFIAEVLRWGCQKYQCGLEFLFAVLRSRRAYIISSIEWTTERKLYFKILCEKLTFSGELKLVTELLHYCVPDAKHCAKIKRTMAKSFFTSDECERLTVKGEFPKLEEYLNFFYPVNIPESKEIANDLWMESVKMFIIENDFSKFKDQFRFGANALNEIFSQCSPHEKAIVRIIMFSNEGMLKLHHLIRDKTFPNVIVKRKISPLFQSNRNKRKLRSKLISFLTPEELRADPKAKENYLKALSDCGL